ncbi:MAG: TolC family protein, partial [Proteobacteria bacterium]|nr:TolC family protein [Pseudomonadota bacterium]
MTQGLNFRRHGLYIVATLLLGACAVGPDYRQPPDIDIGEGWSHSPDSTTARLELAQWWTSLDDPVLDRLVTDALSRNLSLRQAYARINEARALRDRAAGGYAPVVGTSGSV